jgi:hypothetical protein
VWDRLPEDLVWMSSRQGPLPHLEANWPMLFCRTKMHLDSSPKLPMFMATIRPAAYMHTSSMLEALTDLYLISVTARGKSLRKLPPASSASCTMGMFR